MPPRRESAESMRPPELYRAQSELDKIDALEELYVIDDLAIMREELQSDNVADKVALDALKYLANLDHTDS